MLSYLSESNWTDYQNIDVTNKIVITKAGSAEANDTRSAYRLREQKRQELFERFGIEYTSKPTVDNFPQSVNQTNQ